MQFDSQNTETVDEEVWTAGQAAIESGRMTPLLKVELWAKIQSRRLSEGKEELQVQFNRTPRTPLTDTERMKQKDRRESNRMAAQKCRRKKKETKCKLEQIRQELEERNRELKAKVSALEEEMQSVQSAIRTLYGQNLTHVPHTIEPLVVNEAYTLPQISESTVTTPPQTHVKTNSVKATLPTSDIISPLSNEEDEELRDLWYFHSSQEVPTSSLPPQRSHSITTPLSEVDAQDEDMMDDKWLGCSFVNLNDYIE